MPCFVSVTRLRLRDPRFMLPFIWHSVRINGQARRADGCLAVRVRRHNESFWTLTLWKDQSSMRAFMLSGAHKKAMPKLAHWCDEAALAHWEQESDAMPEWPEAELHLAENGRISNVAHPSPAHAMGSPMGGAYSSLHPVYKRSEV